ncbi:MAG: hypothetical protein KatS3mg001_080 [Candidatus Pacearchaeota archaeon]|nr:MAG: hypothetical protein KatS3mg001_080 [Candidatus Pacearchaeota archaeon]
MSKPGIILEYHEENNESDKELFLYKVGGGLPPKKEVVYHKKIPKKINLRKPKIYEIFYNENEIEVIKKRLEELVNEI